MEIKFKVDSAELNAALGVVKIVSPQVTPTGGGGYLFVVQGDKCCIYSKNSGHEVRASFKVTDVEGEGPFMYPADHVDAFAYVKGVISMTATSEGEAFKVKYTHGGSGVSEHVSFDPRQMHSFEKDVVAAQAAVEKPKRYSIKILLTALGMAKSFMAKPNDPVSDEANKTIRIFGEADPELAKKANNYMFASNGTEACYFYSTAFFGQDLSAPAQHLPLIEAFLSKSLGAVTVYPTAKNTYIINSNDDVFGWPHHDSMYKSFAYLAKSDEVVAHVDAKAMLYQLQYMRAELPKKKTKIRLHFDPSDTTFKFSSLGDTNAVTSLPVAGEKGELKVDSEVVAPANVDHLIHLFEGIKSEKLEFRIKIIPADAKAKRPKDLYMFRSIDEFLVNEEGTFMGMVAAIPEGFHVCKVTRFAPGID